MNKIDLNIKRYTRVYIIFVKMTLCSHKFGPVFVAGRELCVKTRAKPVELLYLLFVFGLIYNLFFYIDQDMDR